MCEERWLSWSGSADRLLSKLLRGSQGEPASSDLPYLRPSPRKEEQSERNQSVALPRGNVTLFPSDPSPSRPAGEALGGGPQSPWLGGGSSRYRSFFTVETCTVEGPHIARATLSLYDQSLFIHTPTAYPHRVVEKKIQAVSLFICKCISVSSLKRRNLEKCTLSTTMTPTNKQHSFFKKNFF